jgi:Sugar (and other) transporter
MAEPPVLALPSLRHRQRNKSEDSLSLENESDHCSNDGHHKQQARSHGKERYSSLHDDVTNDGIMKVGLDDETDDEVPHSRDTPSTFSAVSGASSSGSSDFWQTLAGVAGNVLEWYDFAVFGYFSDILGEVFFPPNQGGNASTTESFLVFGGAFVTRPIGGALMGYIGDIYGRKKALVLSIFLMAFPTFAMGCLPGYARIGKWAIVLLVFVRLLQGLSVGGQLMSSLVFTLENHDPAKWGLYGSFVMAAANL